jgi:hypothetical protein
VQIEYENKISPDEDKFSTAALKAPSKWFTWLRSSHTPTSPEQRKASAEIRKHLIENYMDLLSARFLEIAVYYLLQAIGSNPAEPVLVLMAFATGLMADAIIDRIRKFARDMAMMRMRRLERNRPTARRSPCSTRKVSSRRRRCTRTTNVT